MRRSLVSSVLFGLSAVLGNEAIAQPAAIISVGDKSTAVSNGSHYKSLRSKTLLLHFDEKFEPLARRLLPRFESYAQKKLRELKIELDEPVPIFLSTKKYGNASVSQPWISESSHMKLSPRLSAVELNDFELMQAGFDEGPYDVFTHEFMHYIEFERELNLLSPVMGDVLLTPPITRWLAEGWAVVHESAERPFKGRMQPAVYKSFLLAGLTERKSKRLHQWDLSWSNPDWSYGGSHYLLGANFLHFLSQRYGSSQVDRLLTERRSHFHSDYYLIFGKDFDELFEEFADAMEREASAPLANPGAEIFFDPKVSQISSLGINDRDEIVFYGAFNEKTPRFFRLDRNQKILNAQSSLEWFSWFTQMPSQAPLEWSLGEGREKIHFFSGQKDWDNTEFVAGIFSYDFASNSRRLSLSLPGATTALVLPDGDTYAALRQVDMNQTVFTLERGSLSKSSGPAQEILRLNQFASVASLKWDAREKSFYFSAIPHGGTWGIYKITGSKIESVIDTPAQDLMPQPTPQGILFLSSADDKNFQVYRLSGEKLCQLTHEPYFVDSFVQNSIGEVFVSSLRGAHRSLVRYGKDASCTPSPRTLVKKSPPVSPPPAEISTAKVFEEPAWKSWIPQTVSLMPRYSRPGGWGAQALVGSESPYQNWSWTTVGDWKAADDGIFVLGTTLEFRQAFPYIYRVSAEYGPYAKSKNYIKGSHFLNTFFDVRRNLGLHSFQLQAIMTSKDLSPDSQGGISASYGFLYSFSNTQKTLLAAEAQRGWEISTGARAIPLYLGARFNAYALYGKQNIYLPVDTLFPTHSLGLHFTEIKAFHDTISAYGTEVPDSKWSAVIRPDIHRSPGFSEIFSSYLDLSGYEGSIFNSGLVALANVTYSIPLNFLRYGFMQVLGYRWANPETSQMEIAPFYDWAWASTSLRSYGVKSNWTLWLNEEHQSGIALNYTLAKELDQSKKVTQLFTTEMTLSF